MLRAYVRTSNIKTSVDFRRSKLARSKLTLFSTKGHLTRSTKPTFPLPIYLLMISSTSLKALRHSWVISAVVINVSGLHKRTYSSSFIVEPSCFKTLDSNDTSNDILAVLSVSCISLDYNRAYTLLWSQQRLLQHGYIYTALSRVCILLRRLQLIMNGISFSSAKRQPRQGCGRKCLPMEATMPRTSAIIQAV
jgi:hypothetical protein